MNKKNVITIFRISLGLSSSNIIFMILIALLHENFIPNYIQVSNIRPYLSLIIVSYLGGNLFVYLLQSGFTLYFIRQLNKDKDSILGEILVLVFLDVIWYWGDYLSSYVMLNCLARYGGSEALIMHGILEGTKMLTLPVGGSGGILFKLAIGMSIFWKRSPLNKKNIQRLLGITAGLATTFILSEIPIFVFQHKLLSFFLSFTDVRVPASVYFTPNVLRYLILLTAVIALSIQLKKGRTFVIQEVLGIILLSMTAWYLPFLTTRYVAMMGSEMLAAYTILRRASYYTGQIDTIAVSLFTVICGMTISWKRAGYNANEYHGN